LPWFAASEAFGKAKAGESGVSSIASALGAYGKSAVDLDEKEQARLDKIRTEGNALAIAMNAEAQAQYSGNKAELKEAQNAIKGIRTNLTNLKVKGLDQQNEVAKEVYKANVELTKTGMEQAGANARYGREDQMIAKVAQQIHQAHPELAPDEVTRQAYQTVKFQGTMYGADQRADQAALAACGQLQGFVDAVVRHERAHGAKGFHIVDAVGVQRLFAQQQRGLEEGTAFNALPHGCKTGTTAKHQFGALAQQRHALGHIGLLRMRGQGAHLDALDRRVTHHHFGQTGLEFFGDSV
jgi:hypothetical protein